MSAITVDGLRKSYGGFEAVADISLEVAAGEVFCMLGPNGAGKTTTTEILEGHRHASAGSVSVLGFDPQKLKKEFRQRIGVVLQSCGVQQNLTVAELIDMYGSWYPKRLPTDHLIELVELDAKRNTFAKDLSGGQKRRLDLALGLVGDPDLLFLDEPTTGFDPHARRQAWETIRQLCSLGKTVWLTTHFMDEAQALADRIAVMVSGQIVAQGTPEQIGGRGEKPTVISFELPPGVARSELPELAGVSWSVDAEKVKGQTQQGILATNQLTSWALERSLSLAGLSIAQPSLEDIYLELTSAQTRSNGAENE